MRMAERPLNRRQERWGSHFTLGQAVSSAVLTGTSRGKDWIMAGILKIFCTSGCRGDNSLAMTVVCKSSKGETDLCRDGDTGASQANKNCYFIPSHSLKAQKLD